MIRALNARLVHRAFETTLVFKGLFAGFETLSGALLYLVPNDRIVALVHWLTVHEITEDPKDAIASALLHAAQTFSVGTQDFYAVYLAGHGALKLGVVLLLARGVLWAYPLAVVVLSGFIAYQVHRYLLQPGLGLVLLTLLDIAVIVLTLLEYRRIRQAN